MKIKKIQIIPCFQDNYCYLLELSEGVILIDPGDYDSIFPILEKKNFSKLNILCTHHHEDHIRAITQIKKNYPCQVFGSDKRIPQLNTLVKKGSLKISGLLLDVIETPGHTKTHIVYYLPQYSALFSGDHIFGAGCGKVMEGSYSQMFSSLQKMHTFPEETKIYFGHEYTLNNLQFAHHIEPENSAIENRLTHTLQMKHEGNYTTPSTLLEEKKTNLFLQAKDVEAFTHLRTLKDNFHPGIL